MLVVRPLPDGSFQELPPQDVVVGEGESAITIPWANFALWTSADAQPFGLFVVPTPQAPEGKRLKTYSIVWNEDQTDALYAPVYEDQPAEVPPLLSRRQVMLALLQLGKLDAILAIVATLPLAVQITWNETSTFVRTDPLLLQMAVAQKWTDKDLDDLFILGATL